MEGWPGYLKWKKAMYKRASIAHYIFFIVHHFLYNNEGKIKYTFICPFKQKKHRKNKSETSEIAYLQEVGKNGEERMGR